MTSEHTLDQEIRDRLVKTVDAAAVPPADLADVVDRAGRRGRRRWAAAVGALVLVSGVGVANASSGLLDPVARMFTDTSESSTAKVGVAKIPPDHVEVGEIALRGGGSATLWVTDPTKIPPSGSRCFYLDVVQDGSRQGQGGCETPTDAITLTRDYGAVIGSVGTLPAASVSLDIDGRHLVTGVAAGYFLIPDTSSSDGSAIYSVTLSGAEGKTVAGPVRMHAPGSQAVQHR